MKTKMVGAARFELATPCAQGRREPMHWAFMREQSRWRRLRRHRQPGFQHGHRLLAGATPACQFLLEFSELGELALSLTPTPDRREANALTKGDIDGRLEALPV